VPENGLTLSAAGFGECPQVLIESIILLLRHGIGHVTRTMVVVVVVMVVLNLIVVVVVVGVFVC
jgi:hypothetical protein